jgi:hypothetical protein
MTGMILGVDDAEISDFGDTPEDRMERFLAALKGGGGSRKAPAVFPELTTEAYQEAVESDRAARPYDLLLQLGLGMLASRSPSLFGAVGEAGQAALANVEKTGNQNVRELVQKAQIGGQIAAGEQQRATRQSLRTALESDTKLTPAQKQIILADPDGAGRTYLAASLQTPRAPTTVTTEQGVFERDPNSPTGLGRRLGDRPAPASTNVTVTGERKGTEKLYTDAATQFGVAQEAARSADRRAQFYDRMEQAIDGFKPGATAELRLNASKLLDDVFGIKVGGNLSDAEVFKSLQARLELEVAPKGQGQITENERSIIRNQIPTLANTPDGVRAILGMMRQLDEYDRKVAQVFRDNARKNGNVPDPVSVSEELSKLGDPLTTRQRNLLTTQRPAADALAAQQPRPAATSYTPEQEDVIKRARAAIARGAQRDAIAKRLRDMGIEPPGDL